MNSTKEKAFIAPIPTYGGNTETSHEEETAPADITSSGIKEEDKISHKTGESIIDKIFVRNLDKSQKSSIWIDKKLHDRLKLLTISINDEIPISDIVSNILNMHLSQYNDIYMKAINKHVRNTMQK